MPCWLNTDRAFFSLRNQLIAIIRSLRVAAIAVGVAWVLAACGTEPVRQQASASDKLSDWPKLVSAIKKQPAIEVEICRIVSTMTLEQKIGQMTQPEIGHITPGQVRDYYIGSVLNGGGSWPNKTKRSSVRDWVNLADQYYEASLTTDMKTKVPIIWGTDAVHGHGNVYGATLFPHNIGLGAAHDPALIERIGRAVGRQVRATGINWVFGPTLAVARDVRWGRTYESFSEDGALVNVYAGAYIKGMQGDFSSDGNVVATAKHFVGDGGTEFGKDQGITKSSKAEMLSIHGQGYFGGLTAGVQTVMASFNSWNDVVGGVNYGKMHGSKELLTETLKEKMGFDGFVVSDWNGIEQVPGCTRVRCAQAINAGVDVAMVPEDWRTFIENTVEQVKSGEIPVARIDDAVTRILRVKFRAGLFGKPPSGGQYSGNSNALIDRDLGREAVRKSLVLLKNNQHVLPMAKGKRVLVVGKSADSLQNQTGGWSLGWQGADNENTDFPVGDTILAGLMEALGAANVTYSKEASAMNLSGFDYVIAVVGETPYAELVGDIEGNDTLRHSRRYPEDLEVLKAVSEKGVPVVTVFVTGRPVWANDLLNLSDAFVVAWLPGTEGKGIADVLVRDTVDREKIDFTGSLSFIWPASECPVPLNSDNNRFETLFGLGYGLKYADRTEVGKFAGNSETLGCRREPVLPIFNHSNHGPFALHISTSANAWQPVRINTDSNAIQSIPVLSPAVSLTTVQVNTQHDAKQVSWHGLAKFQSIAEKPVDLSSYARNSGVLQADILIEELPQSPVKLAIECGAGCAGELDVTKWLHELGMHRRATLRIPLNCFEKTGARLERVTSPFSVTSAQPFAAAFTQIKIVEDPSLGLARPAACP